MTYKIVFCDVDGTLLNKEHRLLDSTLKSIKALQEKNLPFVIVTARGPSGIYPIFKRYKFVCPMVCFSGGLIIDYNGQVLYSNGFTKGTAKKLINFIEKENLDCTWNIYSMDNWIVKDRADERVAREESIVEAHASEGNVDSLTEGAEIGKILCMCNPAHTVEIENRLKKEFPCLSIVRSSDILIEIMNKNISKGESIEFLCKKWDIDIKETVAFGDHFNDLEMLEKVGKPFLMENAPKELKERIGNVTFSNDADGIYHGLKQIGLVD